MNLLAVLVTIFSTMVPGNFYDNYLPMELVDWKVGDNMEYNLKISFLSGTSVRSVVSETEVDGRKAIWIHNTVSILGQTQKIEQLVRREDGALIKLIVNGEEKELPDPGDVEIVEQDYREVTVPAGTFKSVWIKINTKDAKGVETWLNPRDTCMDGVLKIVTPTQMGTATMELTKFTKVPNGKIVPFK